MGENEILTTNCITHLGMKYYTEESSDRVLDEMLSRLRKAIYGLMGSGLHGTNGLNPLCCLKLIQCYVLPRAIYGSEVLPLIQAQKDKIN